MKLPRDVSGEELSRRLSLLGYTVVRQSGSHMRLVRTGEPEHRVTIPAHDLLKVGTLSSILKDVAAHNGYSRDELIRLLWKSRD